MEFSERSILYYFLLGLWPKIFLPVTWHPRSHYVIEIFYIMKIILFAHFGLKIFPFERMRFGGQDSVVPRVSLA